MPKLYTAGARLRMGRDRRHDIWNAQHESSTATGSTCPGRVVPAAPSRRSAAGADSRPPERREPGGGADAPGLHAFPQPCRRHDRREGTPTADSSRQRERAGRQTLPVDAADATSCRASSTRAIVDRRVQERPLFSSWWTIRAAARRTPRRGLQPGDMPTMPIEFSVAAYRLGHSMIRGGYQWNRVFRNGERRRMRFFSSVFGDQRHPVAGRGSRPQGSRDGHLEHLPTNWIADFRRLVDFSRS